MLPKHPELMIVMLAQGYGLLPIPAAADEVRLKNGDVLTGEIVKKETGILVFKTSYAGQIQIQWSEIETLTSDNPVHIILTDNSNLRGPLVGTTEPGAAKIQLAKAKDKTEEEEDEEKNEREFDLLKTRYINPTPDLSGEGVRWTGNINAGGTVTQGNTETKLLRFDAETIARTQHNRYTVGGVFNRVQDHGHNTQFNTRGYGKYDHFLTPQWYAYANATGENDRFRDLRLRSTTGAGSGYQVFETPNLNLAIEGGLNYIKQDYYVAKDESYPGARWAIKYDQLIFKSATKLFHEHEVLVGLQDTSHILLSSKTGLRFPFLFNFNATTQFNYNWDSSPSPGRKKADSTLLFTLGYGW
jgi:putative salt-induced outer membrane protein YdiY